MALGLVAGQKIDDHYTLIRNLGGGMSETWLAQDEYLPRQVVLKFPLLDLEEQRAGQERILKEARLLTLIDSPYVVRVFDIRFHQGFVYFIMEYIDGSTLQEYVPQIPTLRDALVIFQDIAKGLNELHQRNIIHRDVKPTNILVSTRTAQRRICLADLGIATSIQEGVATQKDISGTLRYIAPEVLRGQPATKSSDVYAMGILLDELIAPFAAKLPGSVYLLSKNCLKDSNERLQGAHYLLDEVEIVLSNFDNAGQTTRLHYNPPPSAKPGTSKRQLRREVADSSSYGDHAVATGASQAQTSITLHPVTPDRIPSIPLNEVRVRYRVRAPRLQPHKISHILQTRMAKSAFTWPEAFDVEILADEIELFYMAFWVLNGSATAKWSARVEEGETTIKEGNLVVEVSDAIVPNARSFKLAKEPRPQDIIVTTSSEPRGSIRLFEPVGTTLTDGEKAAHHLLEAQARQKAEEQLAHLYNRVEGLVTTCTYNDVDAYLLLYPIYYGRWEIGGKQKQVWEIQLDAIKGDLYMPTPEIVKLYTPVVHSNDFRITINPYFSGIGGILGVLLIVIVGFVILLMLNSLNTI